MEYNGLTPLDECLKRPEPCLELVELLCQEDSPRNRRSLLGLMQTCSAEKLPALRLMLQKGVRPDFPLEVFDSSCAERTNDEDNIDLASQSQRSTATGSLSRLIVLEKMKSGVSCEERDGDGSKDLSTSSDELTTDKVEEKTEMERKECAARAYPHESRSVYRHRLETSPPIASPKDVRLQHCHTMNDKASNRCQEQDEAVISGHISAAETCWSWLLRAMAGFVKHGVDRQVRFSQWRLSVNLKTQMYRTLIFVCGTL